MPARNGEHGYGSVTKVLHWLTVALVIAQLTVGWTMDPEAAAERSEEAAEAREEAVEEAGEQAEEAADESGDQAEEAAEEAAERADEAAEAESDRAADVEYRVDFSDGIDALDLHVLLGVSILLVAAARVIWRRVGGLPPWSPALSAGERRFAGATEKALLTSLFLMPATGLTLVLTQEDGLVALHVASHVLLGLAVACHLGLVLRHTLLRRDRYLSRMTPGPRRDEATPGRQPT